MPSQMQFAERGLKMAARGFRCPHVRGWVETDSWSNGEAQAANWEKKMERKTLGYGAEKLQVGEKCFCGNSRGSVLRYSSWLRPVWAEVCSWRGQGVVKRRLA